MAPNTLTAVSFILFQIPITAFLKSSLVFHSVINPATSAATAVITIPITFAFIAAFISFIPFATAGNTPPNPVTTVITL